MVFFKKMCTWSKPKLCSSILSAPYFQAQAFSLRPKTSSLSLGLPAKSIFVLSLAFKGVALIRLYFSLSSWHWIYVLVHVDNIIVTCSISNVISKFIHQLQQASTVRDLGCLHHFLGISAIAVPDGLMLSQQHYILDILKHTKMVHETHPLRYYQVW